MDRLIPGGIPRYVRCYDNGGNTFDRFTIVFTKKHGGRLYLGASEHPTHPQGFGQHGESDRGPIDRPTSSCDIS